MRRTVNQQIRFDPVYVGHFKCNLRTIRNGYPAIHSSVFQCHDLYSDTYHIHALTAGWGNCIGTTRHSRIRPTLSTSRHITTGLIPVSILLGWCPLGRSLTSRIYEEQPRESSVICNKDDFVACTIYTVPMNENMTKAQEITSDERQGCRIKQCRGILFYVIN